MNQKSITQNSETKANQEQRKESFPRSVIETCYILLLLTIIEYFYNIDTVINSIMDNVLNFLFL